MTYNMKIVTDCIDFLFSFMIKCITEFAVLKYKYIVHVEGLGIGISDIIYFVKTPTWIFFLQTYKSDKLH